MNTTPVRKFGNSYNSALRGLVSSQKSNRQINVESSLERDYSYLLEFDINVDSYVEQPVTIQYNANGVMKKYTPDFLVKYIDPLEAPILVEIKYREDIRNNWSTLKPKFKAAKEYAKQKGWQFKIYTENEIRGIYLDNAKFLLQFRKNPKLPHEDFREIILRILSSIKETTPDEVLLIAFNDKYRQAELLPTLWFMVGSGLIGCNLFHKLTMKSCIWSVLD